MFTSTLVKKNLDSLFNCCNILHDQDFYYQKKQLTDALIEQEKDSKLFEQICKALLGDKDFKKVQ